MEEDQPIRMDAGQLQGAIGEGQGCDRGPPSELGSRWLASGRSRSEVLGVNWLERAIETVDVDPVGIQSFGMSQIRWTSNSNGSSGRLFAIDSGSSQIAHHSA